MRGEEEEAWVEAYLCSMQALALHADTFWKIENARAG